MENSLGMDLEPRFLQTADALRRLKGTRLLIVTNHDDARMLYTLLFEDYGVEVFAVDAAMAALAVIEQSQPHVIINDICLPEEDSYNLIREIRSLDAEHGG